MGKNDTKKVYVHKPSGAFLPGYGERAYGEWWELPSDVADEVGARDGFGFRAPRNKNEKDEPASAADGWVEVTEDTDNVE